MWHVPCRAPIITLLLVFLGACSGYNYEKDAMPRWENNLTTPFTSREILDPNRFASDLWGMELITLTNGNFVVVNSTDDTMATDAGAVHLFSGSTGLLITSIYGARTNDKLGFSGVSGVSGITALSNGNFVIQSALHDTTSLTDPGAVMIVDSSNGQILTTIFGNMANDKLGISGNGVSGVTDLRNGNVVIQSAFVDSVGFTDVGSVYVINANTGATLNIFTGTKNFDNLGRLNFSGVSGITLLGNGNFVISSPLADNASINNAGLIILANGSTGALISEFRGNSWSDLLGYSLTNGFSPITELSNGNFVIQSSYDDVSGVSDAGSIMLVDGATGVLISTISGTTNSDYLGTTSTNFVSGVTALSNGNFVIASAFDDFSAIIDAGSVMLVSGTTGTVIATLTGNYAYDHFGATFNSYVSGITELTNGYFVVQSPLVDAPVGPPTIVNAGLVTFVNSSTGGVSAQMFGDSDLDYLGSGSAGVSGIRELANGNVLILSSSDTFSVIPDAGSIILVGPTGIPITQISGDDANDYIGGTFVTGVSAVTNLPNGNFIIQSESDDVGGFIDAGSVKLFNGSTGSLISSITGAGTNARLGVSGNGTTGVHVLSNGNYIVQTKDDAIGTLVGSGSVYLIDGTSGSTLAVISGNNTNDFLGYTFTANVPGITLLGNGNFTIQSPMDDVSGVANAGSVKLVNGATGAVITSIEGIAAGDSIGLRNTGSAITVLSNSTFVVNSPAANNSSLLDVGSVKVYDTATGALMSQMFGGSIFDQIGSGGIVPATNGFFILSPVYDYFDSLTNTTYVNGGYIYYQSF